MKNLSLVGVFILLHVISPSSCPSRSDFSPCKNLPEENDLITVPLWGLLFSVGLYLKALSETVE